MSHDEGPVPGGADSGDQVAGDGRWWYCTCRSEAAKEKPEFDLIEKGKLGLEYTIVIVTLRKMQSSKNEEENYRSEPETKDEENKMCLAWGSCNTTKYYNLARLARLDNKSCWDLFYRHDFL